MMSRKEAENYFDLHTKQYNVVGRVRDAELAALRSLGAWEKIVKEINDEMDACDNEEIKRGMLLALGIARKHLLM